MSNTEKNSLQEKLTLVCSEIDVSDPAQLDALKDALEAHGLLRKLSEDVSEDAILDRDEPLLQEENRRFTIFPIKHWDIWDMYMKQFGSFWRHSEVDFTNDYRDFQTLSVEEQTFLKYILAFFAASDGLVNFNLGERFLSEIKVMEALVVYGFQMMMENIHGHVYSLMLDNIVKDKDEKAKLLNAIETIPVIKKMADWAIKWVGSNKRFAYRIVAFALVEGVFFSGAFAAIWWFKKYKGKGTAFLQGLIKSNDFISRDEGMHRDFACLLYTKYVVHKLDKEELIEMVEEATSIATEFIVDALKCELIGMNAELMGQYIKYTADQLLVELDEKPNFKVKNPFTFMTTIGSDSKSNFFEERPTEYQDAYIDNKGLSMEYTEDF